MAYASDELPNGPGAAGPSLPPYPAARPPRPSARPLRPSARPLRPSARPLRPPLTKRMRPGHWVAIDGMAGAVVALFALFASIDHLGGNGFAPLVPIVLAAAVFFPVTLRRRNPVAAFGALIILAILTAGAGKATSLLILLAAAYVLYLTTVASSKRTGFAALALALVVIMVLMLTRREFVSDGSGGGAYVPVAFAMIISWMTGYSVRQRRAYAMTLQYQAASSAVAEERLRIARELHDVVAHSMSVIAVQAGYGQYVIDSSPSDARDALGAIQATSRDALEEMRRMLGVLRQQDAGAGPGAAAADPEAAAAGPPGAGPRGAGPPGAGGVSALDVLLGFRPSAGSPRSAAPLASGAPLPSGAPPASTASGAPLAPAPGLGDLDRLIQRTSGAGIHVTLQRSGRVRAVPAGIDLSAYRIIQEALTNVVKHAGAGARCEVCVEYGDQAIEIRVTDDGGQPLLHAPAGAIYAPAGAIHTPAGATAAGAALAPSSGHGLIGMRERVNLCGGEFSAGPLAPGGYQVTASLPSHGGDQ